MIVGEDVVFLGRVVGKLRADGVFVTYREREHVFRIFNGVGVSVGVLRLLLRKRCRVIKFVVDREGRGHYEVYKVTPEKLLDEGEVWVDKEFDVQKVMSFESMGQLRLSRFGESG